MLGTAKFRVEADTSDAEQGIDRVKEKGRGLGSALLDIGKTAAGVFAGMVATKVPGFLVEAAQGAAEDAAATARLEQTIKNLLKSSNEFSDSELPVQLDIWKGQLDDAILSGQKLAFSDDEIRNSFNFLATATGGLNEGLERQKLAMDLARGANIPLQTASLYLGKITEENTTALQRLGFTFGKDATQAEVLAAVQAKFAGQADAYAKSTAGQFEQTKIRMSELKETIGYALIPIINVLLGLVLKLVDWAEKKLPPAIALVKNAFSGLAEPVKTVFGWLEKLYKLEWKLTVAAFDKLREFAGAAWGPAVDKLKELATAGWDKLQKAWEVVGPILERAGNWSLDQLMRLGDVDWGELLTTFKGMADIDWQGLSKSSGETGNALKEFLGPAIIDAAKALFDAFKPLGPVLRDELGPAVGELAEALAPLAEFLTVVLVVALRATLEAIKFLAPALSVILIGAIKSTAILITGFAGIIRGITEALQGVIDFIVGVFTGDWDRAWQGLKAIFSGFWTVLSTIVTTAWNLFVNDVKTLFAAFVVLFGDFFTKTLPNSLANLGQWFVQKGKDIIGGIQDGVEFAYTTTKQWFVDLPGNLRDAMGDLLKLLYKKGLDLLSGLKDGVVDGGLVVWNMMKAIPSTLVSAIGDLTGLLVDAGKGVLTGLWNGIESMKNWFIDKAKAIGGWIEDAIPDWIPHSPPKRPVEIGQSWMVGFAVGIAKGEGVLAEAVKLKVVGTVQGLASGAATGTANWWDLPGAAETVAGWNSTLPVNTPGSTVPVVNGTYDAAHNLTFVNGQWIQGQIQAQDLQYYGGPSPYLSEPNGPWGRVDYSALSGANRRSINIQSHLEFHGPTNAKEVEAALDEWWEKRLNNEFGFNAVLSGVIKGAAA